MIATRTVRVKLRDGTMGAYLALPERLPAPGLTVDFFRQHLGG